ncbi:MAG: CARDB domain-containing protein [candidate division Zixibacteria bacterium]|jgi:hypothetical protein|nr:CARDB domain-containing protein [candidate division Zixibacteria bacterium]
MRSLKFLAVSVLMLSSAAITLASGQSYTTFHVQFGIGSVADTGGVAHGTLAVWPAFDGDDFQIEIDSIVGLEYDGPRHYSWPGQVGDTFAVDFTYRVPDGELSSISVVVTRGDHKTSRSRWYDLRGDRALIYYGDPSKPNVYPLNYQQAPRKIVTVEDIYGPPPDQQEIRILPPDTVPQPRSRWKGYDVAPVVTRIEDTAGLAQWGFCVEDELDSGWVLLGKTDSIIAKMPRELWDQHLSPNRPPESEREKMERLERTPLDYTDEEWLTVDDTLFMRRRGENKFEPIALASTGELLGDHKPKGRAPDSPEVLVLDLREPDDMEFIRYLTDSIAPTQVNGYYKVTIEFRQMREIIDRGIKGYSFDSWQWAHPREGGASTSDSSGQTSADETDGEPPGDKSLTLFYDGFDSGFFDTTWTSWAEDGFYWWGPVSGSYETCETYSSTGSVWPAGGVGMGSCDYIVDAYTTWMEMDSAVSLQSTQNNTITFRLYSDLDPSLQGGFYCYISETGATSDWTLKATVTSAENWRVFTIYVADDWDRVYVAFRFVKSNAVSARRGVFVDDVRVEGDALTYPDLTFYQPISWDHPLVFANEWGSTQTTTLYAGETTYLSFAIRNQGQYAAGQFNIRVYDIYESSQYLISTIPCFSAINAGEEMEFPNNEIVVSPSGSHTIVVRANQDHDLEESDYTNNAQSRVLQWLDPPPPEPNLQWYVPNYWSGAIAYPTPVYSGQTSHVSYALRNNGVEASGSFVCRIYMNGISVHSKTIPGMSPGEQLIVPTVPVSFPEGVVTLELHIDDDGQVDESTELDNNWITPPILVRPPSIEVYGHVEYQHLANGGSSATYSPARHIRVELWDENVDGPDQWLDSATTDQWGSFAFQQVSNVDQDGTRLDVYVKAWAMNDAAVAWKGSAKSVEGSPRYGSGALAEQVIPHLTPEAFDYASFDSYVQNDVRSGDVSFQGPGSATPPIWIYWPHSNEFFLVDAVLDSWLKWSELRPNDFIDTVNIWAGPDRDYSNYLWRYGDTIYDLITIAADVTNPDPPGLDIFDRATILHEHGHKIAKVLDILQQGSGTHSFWLKVSDGLAASEGWAHFWAAYCLGKARTSNAWNDFQDTSWIDVETGVFGVSGTSGPFTPDSSANTRGTDCEASVAGVFRDIYDNQTGIEEFSSRNEWNVLPLPHSADGVGDSLSLGIQPILTALLDKAGPGARPQTLMDFWDSWFKYGQSQGHTQAMVDIWYEHGMEIKYGCCTGMTGNTNGDPDDIVDLSDITALVDWLFLGQPIGCVFEANVTGDPDGSVDLADAICLVNYLINGGPPPAPCRGTDK